MTTDVALFVPTLAGGGAERMMLNLAGGLQRRGYDVDLVVVSRSGDLADDVPTEVSIVDLGADRIVAALVPLVRYLRRKRPQTLLSTINSASLVAVVAAHLSATDVRTVVRLPNTRFANPSRADRPKERLVARAGPWVFPLADAVVAISTGAAEEYRSVCREPLDGVHVVYNPVVDDGIRTGRAEPVDHPAYREETSVVVAAGRLVVEKDFETLVRAFARLGGETDAELVVLGEGPRREALEALSERLGVDDRVWLPGYVDNPYPFMHEADVFALSSRSEGFGNVLVEALACGTTVVATDCPNGPAEILENGRYGLLVEPGVPDDLAAALQYALANPLPASVLEGRARKFSLASAVDHYESVLFPERAGTQRFNNVTENITGR